MRQKPLKLISLTISLGTCLFGQALNAESFKILGSRPLGMGGAYVAVAEDDLAQYWNPAGIAKQKNFDAGVEVNGKVEFTGNILKDVSSVGELADKFTKVQDAQKNGGSIDVDKMGAIFKTVSVMKGLNDPEKGVLAEAQGGLNLRIMRVAISINNFTSAGGTPYVDTNNLGLGSSSDLQGIKFTDGGTVSAADKADPSRLIAERDRLTTVITDMRPTLTQAGITIDASLTDQQLANALINGAITANISDADITNAVGRMETNKETVKEILKNVASGSPYTNNTSNVTLRGISIFEIAAGYAHRFFVKDLYVGGNLKALIGRVGYFKEEFLKKDVGRNDVLADFDKNTKQSIQPGIDFGILYNKRKTWRTKFGIVAKNVNNPSFDQPEIAAGEPKYRVQPQVRAGVALYPLKRTFWVIASDLDLTNNITPVPGFSSRIWSLGTEIDLVNSNMFNLALRAGLMNNLSESDSRLTYTAGFGLKILHFFLDVAGAVSSKTEEVKSGESSSQKVPQNAQIGIALGLNF